MARQEELLPAYLAVGGDDLMREKVVKRIKGRLDEAYALFNLDELTAGPDMGPDELVASLNTMPVGEPPRVVVVHEADKLPKPVSEAAISYLENPNPGCVLLLSSEKLAKNTRLYKAVAKVGDKAIIDCSPRSRKDLPNYVAKLAGSHGLTMDWEAARALVDRVGESTTMLDTQLRSLAQLKGAPGVITVADVEAHVARVAEVKPWEFLDRLSARDATRSLALYELISSQWRKPDFERIGLLTLITTRVRELVCTRSLAMRGEASYLAKTLGKADWQVRSYAGWARAFGPGELEAALAACADCELALKSGANPDEAMLRLIASVCG